MTVSVDKIYATVAISQATSSNYNAVALNKFYAAAPYARSDAATLFNSVFANKFYATAAYRRAPFYISGNQLIVNVIQGYDYGPIPVQIQASGLEGVLKHETINIYYLESGAPTLNSPKITRTTPFSTTANLEVVTTGANGTLYWVVTPSRVQPTPAQIIAGLDDLAAAAIDSGTVAISSTGTKTDTAAVPAGGDVYAHFYHVDASTKKSNVMTANTGVRAPTDIQWAGTHSISENASIGDQVGGVLTGTDPQDDNLLFTMPDTAGGRFAIGAAGDTVVVASALDYETATSHNITVRAFDGEAFFDEVFTITVTDVAVEIWYPSTIPTLRFWYKMQDLVGSDGSAVALVPDASGYGNDATQVTAGNRPTLELVELDGKNTIHLTASHILNIPTGIINTWTGATMLAVIKNDSDPGAGSGAPFITGTDGAVNHYAYSDGNVYIGDFSNARKSTGNPTFNLAAAHILGIDSSSTWTMRHNGKIYYGPVASTYAGRSDPRIGAAWYGVVAEILIFEGVLSTLDRQKSEGYLAHLWASLKANLASEHPYKVVSPGTGADISARYWRLYVTALTSGNIVFIGEIQFTEAATGFGSTMISGGTISVDSTYGAAYTMDNAIDGEIGTGANVGWLSTDTALPHWWKYDFGAGVTKTITGVSFITGGIKDFELQYSSNDLTWNTLISVTGQTGWNANGFEYRRFVKAGLPTYTGSPHGPWQHWRIRLCEDAGGTISTLTEIEMRATPGGADQCTGGTAIENGHNTTYDASKAFDNDNATFFASTPSGQGVYVGYSFAAPVIVAQITLRARQDNSPNQAPKTAVIEYASSASGPWHFGWMILNQTSWSLSETKTFTDPNYV